MLDQLPSTIRVMREHLAAQLPGLPFMFLFRRRVLAGFIRLLQGLDDAVAHFTGGLASERHRNDGFRIFDRCEQSQESLNEQLRLSGTGGSLNNEGTRRIQRLQALGLIADALSQKSPPCRIPRHFRSIREFCKDSEARNTCRSDLDSWDRRWQPRCENRGQDFPERDSIPGRDSTALPDPRRL